MFNEVQLNSCRHMHVYAAVPLLLAYDVCTAIQHSVAHTVCDRHTVWACGSSVDIIIHKRRLDRLVLRRFNKRPGVAISRTKCRRSLLRTCQYTAHLSVHCAYVSTLRTCQYAVHMLVRRALTSERDVK